jgi:phosphate uptake regulator
MKRKVIQIADSTQLISLPRKWAVRHGIKKGDELNIEEDGNKIMISTDNTFQPEKVELDITSLDPMILRSIFALYKRGVDEIRINFEDSEQMKYVQAAIGREAVGFEITDQGKNYCIIKNVAGEPGEFDSVLKRTFLLLISMTKESLESIKNGDFEHLKNIAFLEEANNRFTTTCRRYLNKIGGNNFKYIGPLYYIIEDIENLADQYKFLCNFLYERRDKKIKIGREVLELYEEVNNILYEYYQLYYKFSKQKLVSISNHRRRVVKKAYELFHNSPNSAEIIVIHHLITAMQKIFNLVGPYLVMAL